MLRRRGFTLIELLVVIAIIGILAAMLFPVFARARESARKTQCLANVKNIAIAVNMYYTDYDKFMPNESSAEVSAWFIDNDVVTCESGVGCKATGTNPYLKHPVVLDDYTKNRDIWKCPSGKYVQTFAINFGYGDGRWFQYMRDKVGESGDCIGSLSATGPAYPPGWGGDTTDSFVQQNCGAGSSAFSQQVAVPYTLNGLSTSAMGDSAKQVAVADAGIITETLDRTSWVAYPDYCRIDSDLCNTACGGDWSNCSWSQACSPLRIDSGGDGHIARDAQARKTELGSRHLGGSNLGFADGHAKWFPSETILFGGENWSGHGVQDTLFFGLGVCFNPTATPRP